MFWRPGFTCCWLFVRLFLDIIIGPRRFDFWRRGPTPPELCIALPFAACTSPGLVPWNAACCYDALLVCGFFLNLKSTFLFVILAVWPPWTWKGSTVGFV